jgi:hypothetical protein
MDLGLVPAGFDHALNYWRMQVGRDGLDTVAVARRGVIVKAGARAGEAVSTALSGAPLVADALATLAARAHWSALPGAGPLSALDLLRVGHVVLNDGQWAGRRVVSAADLAAAMHTSPIESNAAVDPTPTWFTNGRRADGSRSWPDAPPGTRVLFDAHHGVCIVVPEWDMVIARVGTDGPPLGGHTQVLNSLLRRLGMAVSPLASAP